MKHSLLIGLILTVLSHMAFALPGEEQPPLVEAKPASSLIEIR